jgi:mannosyltransferase
VIWARAVETARQALFWAIPAALTLAICLTAIQRPVLWQDELATVSASTRSLYDLVRMSARVDAVVAPYYTLMHLWTMLFGASPVAVRVPSALAMAAGAGMTAVLGARLFGRRAGLLAGLVLAFVPAVSKYGQEARPYALALLLAAVSTLLLVQAMAEPRPRRWAAYGLSVAALACAQLIALLLVAAHALAVAVQWRRQRDTGLRGWLASTTAALAAVSPIIVVAMLSRRQVGWIAETSALAVARLPGTLFAAPAVAGLVIGLGLLAAFRHGTPGRLAAAVALAPAAALVLLSLLVPLLVPRYLLFTVVGWVLLAGATLSRLQAREAAALVAAIVVLGLPAQVDIRGATKNNQPDYRAIAEFMQSRTRPGDAIVVPTDRGIRFRIGLRVYLPEDAWPDDVLAISDPAAAASLDSKQCEPATCLGSPPRIWVGCTGPCANPLTSIRPETATAIQAKGYVADQVWRVSGGGIALYSAKGRG